jgi:hypothetical protein
VGGGEGGGGGGGGARPGTQKRRGRPGQQRTLAVVAEVFRVQCFTLAAWRGGAGSTLQLDRLVACRRLAVDEFEIWTLFLKVFLTVP